MSSLLTNASALTALQSLNMTQQNLATTQTQISTGLKVANASDNAAYWSIAQSLQSNTGVIGAVNDSIAQSQSIIGAATAAINNVITTIHAIQTALTEAESPSRRHRHHQHHAGLARPGIDLGGERRLV